MVLGMYLSVSLHVLARQRRPLLHAWPLHACMLGTCSNPCAYVAIIIMMVFAWWVGCADRPAAYVSFLPALRYGAPLSPVTAAAELLQKSQTAGEVGDVDISMALAAQAEELQQQHDRLHRTLTAPDRTMMVCDICGVFINSTDNDQRRQVRPSMGSTAHGVLAGRAGTPRPWRAEVQGVD